MKHKQTVAVVCVPSEWWRFRKDAIRFDGFVSERAGVCLETDNATYRRVGRMEEAQGLHPDKVIGRGIWIDHKETRRAWEYLKASTRPAKPTCKGKGGKP